MKKTILILSYTVDDRSSELQGTAVFFRYLSHSQNWSSDFSHESQYDMGEYIVHEHDETTLFIEVAEALCFQLLLQPRKNHQQDIKSRGTNNFFLKKKTPFVKGRCFFFWFSMH